MRSSKILLLLSVMLSVSFTVAVQLRGEPDDIGSTVRGALLPGIPLSCVVVQHGPDAVAIGRYPLDDVPYRVELSCELFGFEILIPDQDRNRVPTIYFEEARFHHAWKNIPNGDYRVRLYHTSGVRVIDFHFEFNLSEGSE